MNITIQRINQAHNTDNGYRSPIADTYSSQSMIERYIKARLTNRQTIRILMDQDYLQEEQKAIAQDIAKSVLEIFK